MRATHQVGYIVQNLTVKNSVIGMQCETILLKGYHDNNNTTSTENTINISDIRNKAEDRHASLSMSAYVAVSSLTAIFIAGQHVLFSII